RAVANTRSPASTSSLPRTVRLKAWGARDSGIGRLDGGQALLLQARDDGIDARLVDLGHHLVAVVGDVGDALDHHVEGLPLAALRAAEGVVHRHARAVVDDDLGAHCGATIV